MDGNGGEAAMRRALASKHDPASRTIKARTPRTYGHRVKAGGIDWCVDDFCPVNRATEELRRLGISDVGE